MFILAAFCASSLLVLFEQLEGWILFRFKNPLNICMRGREPVGMLPLNWSLQPSHQEHMPCIPFLPSASSYRKDPICYLLSRLCAMFLVQMQVID